MARKEDEQVICLQTKVRRNESGTCLHGFNLIQGTLQYDCGIKKKLVNIRLDFTRFHYFIRLDRKIIGRTCHSEND